MGDAGDDAGRGSSEEAPPYVSYGTFGEQFFTRAITLERVVATVNLLAGQPIAFGPTGAGPGRLVRITARGGIGDAAGEPVPGDPPGTVAFRVTLPVDLSFDVDLGLEVHRFTARLTVPLVLAARAVDGLRVFIDITPPAPGEIGIELRAQGLRASVVQRVAGVEGEVRRFVARYVAREVDKPHIRTARMLDVGSAISSAWEHLAPRSGEAPALADELAEDLAGAVEERMATTAEPAS